MKELIKKILPESVLTYIRRFKKNHNTFDINNYYLLEKTKVTYSQDLLYTFHNADFIKDPLFLESYDLGKNTDNGTLLKNYDIHWRVHVLCWAASHAMHLEGDFVDCGVHTGICARAVINYVDFKKSSKKYYLLDTFNGLDKKYSTDWEMQRNTLMGYDNEDGEVLFNGVKKTFEEFNVSIIRGTVPDTLIQVDSDKISYLSIDMNCVAPEIAALEFFWEKMVSGGIIILDDYGYANSTNDQKKAHDEFAHRKMVKILTLPTCQGLIIKP
jgi:O-methyltransferase